MSTIYFILSLQLQVREKRKEERERDRGRERWRGEREGKPETGIYIINWPLIKYYSLSSLSL